MRGRCPAPVSLTAVLFRKLITPRHLVSCRDRPHFNIDLSLRSSGATTDHTANQCDELAPFMSASKADIFTHQMHSKTG
jgi:hypothetical protein